MPIDKHLRGLIAYQLPESLNLYDDQKLYWNMIYITESVTKSLLITIEGSRYRQMKAINCGYWRWDSDNVIIIESY